MRAYYTLRRTDAGSDQWMVKDHSFQPDTLLKKTLAITKKTNISIKSIGTRQPNKYFVL